VGRPGVVPPALGRGAPVGDRRDRPNGQVLIQICHPVMTDLSKTRSAPPSKRTRPRQLRGWGGGASSTSPRARIREPKSQVRKGTEASRSSALQKDARSTRARAGWRGEFHEPPSSNPRPGIPSPKGNRGVAELRPPKGHALDKGGGRVEGRVPRAPEIESANRNPKSEREPRRRGAPPSKRTRPRQGRGSGGGASSTSPPSSSPRTEIPSPKGNRGVAELRPPKGHALDKGGGRVEGRVLRAPRARVRDPESQVRKGTEASRSSALQKDTPSTRAGVGWRGEFHEPPSSSPRTEIPSPKGTRGVAELRPPKGRALDNGGGRVEGRVPRAPELESANRNPKSERDPRRRGAPPSKRTRPRQGRGPGGGASSTSPRARIRDPESQVRKGPEASRSSALQKDTPSTRAGVGWRGEFHEPPSSSPRPGIPSPKGTRGVAELRPPKGHALDNNAPSKS